MTRRAARYVAVFAVMIAAGPALSGCEAVESALAAAGSSKTPEPVTEGAVEPVRDASLAGLPVEPPGTMNGYDRDRFGQSWSDDVTVAGGHNGCDTRNDRLRVQLREVQIKPGTHGCVVLSGALADPYTGQRIYFRRGGGRQLVDIDHRVALGNAWRHGAAAWSTDKRRDFANDPMNLVAVSASQNRSKGDKGAEAWLPPSGRCDYVRRQITVKKAYGLSVSPDERRAMQSVLTGCGERN